MKKRSTGILFAFLFISTFAFAQSSIDEIVKEGIAFHDSGQYDKAIETYKKALEIDPKSALVNYEIAFSYFNKKDYESSVKYTDIVLNEKKEFIIQSALIKGSALDMLGKTKESIAFFKDIIDNSDGHYLLHYNLGVNYYKIQELDNAEASFIKAIESNPNHASSHWLLANIHNAKENPVQTLLAVHYFLFLEPDSGRSKKAYALLQKHFKGNVTRDKEKENTINISLRPLEEDDPFSAPEMMISMLEAAKSTKENEGKTEDELFVENTAAFFSVMGELKKEEYKEIWWTFYTTFFYDVSKSEHMTAYCNYISQGSNKNAVQWLKDNDDKLNAFDKWLSNEE